MVTALCGSAANDPSTNFAEWVFHDVDPIFTQLRDKMKWAILSGQLQPGENIPSVCRMASILHISTNTAARAYKLILDEGLIEFVKGRICRVIFDNASIQKTRAQEARILCCNYAQGMMALVYHLGYILSYRFLHLHSPIAPI